MKHECHDQDREYFEQGVLKYYSLHIHEVNGHRPEPADIQRIADLIGVRFDHPLQLQAPTHEQEGPDLCLCPLQTSTSRPPPTKPWAWPGGTS